MQYPLFLSVILVVRNQAPILVDCLKNLSEIVSKIASDYEIIIIDNASDDASIETLRDLTGPSGLPNLQVFALTREVEGDACSLIGLENSLGDYVAVWDPLNDDAKFLSPMLDKVIGGFDVVFSKNTIRQPQRPSYQFFSHCFNGLYKWSSGVNLSEDAPRYRLLSKNVVNFILKHPQPAVTYRHLPATGGFSKITMTYTNKLLTKDNKKLGDSIEQGVRLLVSTTKVPMRIVTTITLFGAISNLLYSLYVVAIGLFKSDVAPGWVSMSLQQSGMFFLISLVLLVLCEYILNMSSLGNEGPAYHIAREFTSARMTRKEKLNIEAVSSSLGHSDNPNEIIV